MRKNILLYTVAFFLLGIVLILFRAYMELSNYTALTTRHSNVRNYFQNLSTQLNNAAIQHPNLIKGNLTAKKGKLFFTDSLIIVRQLDLLTSTVEDSVNIGITAKLNTAVRSELSWLLKNNLADSILLNRSSAHIIAFNRIVALIDEGTRRTVFLIAFRKQQLDDKINVLRLWMIVFTIGSFLLLIYTTFKVYHQESKIKNKEHELSVVLDRVKDGVVSLDKDWRYTFLNDAAMITHPLGKTETIGKVIWDLHPQMKGTVFWDKYHEAMSSKKVVEVDSYYEPFDTWFSVTIYPSDNGLTIFYKDVTESKKAIQKLLQTQKELADYKFALDEANIVGTTDQHGKILYVNDNFCKLSKYRREELIGQNHRIVNSGYHPASFIKDLWDTITNGRIWRGEIKNRAKDGSIYWVATTIVPFLDGDGKPYQYIGIRSDITERKKAEQKLAKSEKIYKTIASSIPGSMICLLDPDYRYWLIEGDMLEKLGYSKEQLLGEKAADVLSSEAFAEVEDDLKRAFDGETISRESGSAGYQIISRFIPLRDENNSVYAVMTVAIDITELKTAQNDISRLNRGLEEKIIKRTEQLKKSNDDLEAFSYSVSHDLRSPLRGIIGFSTILEEDYAGELDVEGKRIISVIKNNTLRMGSLIDDLLAFSRMGKQNLSKVKVDTNALIAEIIGEQMHDVTNSNIGWIIQALPGAYADIKTFRQVWINLLSNAIKYSGVREHPVIEIGSYENADQQVFYVKDNGAGFNEEYKNKLFKVFQRLHNADEFEGTGVGLAIVEKIISRHGGSVWAEGKEDEGACFYFSIPKLPEGDIG